MMAETPRDVADEGVPPKTELIFRLLFQEK